MALKSKTFRIFVSSTFSDLKEERNALQKFVFPKLRKLCMQHGTKFHAIDLRWGVREEAALDQQTMQICLGELNRCQKVSPRPNFIILLGNRYGWRPLPAEIPADEFEEIECRIVDDDDRMLLKDWYKRDENTIRWNSRKVSAVYILKPRQGYFEKWTNWEPVESRLRHILLHAIKEIELTDEERSKYTASATHQEILKGAVKAENPKSHVFCFFRKINGLPQDRSVQDFIDLDNESNLDVEANTKLDELKKHLCDLLPNNIYEYEAKWTGSGISNEHIDPLCKNVYDTLSHIILEEVKRLREIDPLNKEIADHGNFSKDRSKFFTGRIDILQSINDYVNEVGKHPLVVFGVSGSGKSALMAHAIENIRKAHPEAEIMFRFVGATPKSSNVSFLLKNLCQQIYKVFNYEQKKQYELSEAHGESEEASRILEMINAEYTIPEGMKKLPATFRNFVSKVPEEKKLIIFLDALDQLSNLEDARGLAWLPSELPKNIWLIVSTLPGECLLALEKKFPKNNLIELTPMPTEEGSQLLDLWLQEAGRKLQKHQQEEVLVKFKQNGLPLYLKLAFEEARCWKSYTEKTKLSPDTLGVIKDLFTRLALDTNHGKMLVSRSLSFLFAAKNGLSEDEMLEILSRDGEVFQDFKDRAFQEPPEKKLPVIVWSRLYFDLEPYLAEHDADGASLMAFYHRQLGEVVEAHYCPAESKKERRRQLAEYFGDQPLYIESDKGKISNLRKMSELPYQQAHSKLWDQLKHTLTDFDFLQAKVDAVGPQFLIDDYEEAVGAGCINESLQLIKDSLRLSVPALTQDSNQLAGQLIGRLYSSDLSEIQTLIEQARKWKDALWLCPLTASLITPGGPLLSSLIGHTEPISAVAMIPGGPYIVSVSSDKTLRVWDIERGIEVHTLTGHTDSISSVAVTPDGRYAVSGSGDKTLKVWDLEKGEEVRTLTGHTDSISSVAVTPDGRYVVSGSSDKTLKVWDIEKGIEIHTLTGHTGWVSTIAITPDGLYAISGSADETLKVWDIEKGIEVRTLIGHASPVSAVAVTPDSRVVSGSGTLGGKHKTLKIWNLKNGKEVYTTEELSGSVADIAVTPDGRYALFGSTDGTLKMWDLEKGVQVRNFASPSRGVVNAVAVTPDGRRAISGSHDAVLKVWDLEAKEEISTFAGHSDEIWMVAVTSDGLHAVSASKDMTLKIWDLEEGIEVRTLTGHTYWVSAVAVTPDGRHAVSASWDHSLKVWNLLMGQEEHTLIGHTKIVNTVAVIPNGRRAISSSLDRTLRVWDLNTGKELSKFLVGKIGGFVGGMGVAVIPNGRRAVLASGKNLKVLDLKTGKEVRTITTSHTSVILAVAVTPDGNHAISASWDNTLKVLDLKNGKEIHTLIGHTNFVWSVVVTPDGRYAVSVSRDKTLRVWNLKLGTSVAMFTGNDNLRACAIGPDGLTVVAGEGSGLMHFLRLQGSEFPESSLKDTIEVRDQRARGASGQLWSRLWKK